MKLWNAMIAVASMLAASPLGLAQTIHMTPKAVVAGKTIQVGDLGTITGCDALTAEKLAQTVVVAKFADSAKVRAEDVLLAVMTQGDPRIGCKVQIQGAAECEVRTAPDQTTGTQTQGSLAGLPVSANRAVTADEPAAATPANNIPTAAAATATPGKPDFAKPGSGPTLAALLKEQVINDLEAPAEDVHVTFETNSPLLDTPAAAGQRWQFRTLIGGKNALGTTEWDAQLMQGRQIVQKLLVTGRVLRRVQGVITMATIERGEVVAGKQLKLEDRWLDRKMPGLVSGFSEVIGQEALRGLPAGTYLDSRDFKPVELAAYGDTVTVYFLSGNLRIKGAAKALSPGRLHDRITVQNEGTKEKYDGLLIGRHVVVVGNALDAKTEQQLRENP